MAVAIVVLVLVCITNYPVRARMREAGVEWLVRVV